MIKFFKIAILAVLFSCDVFSLNNEFSHNEQTLKSDRDVLDNAISLFVFKHESCDYEQIKQLLKPLIEKVKKQNPDDYELLISDDIDFDKSIDKETRELIKLFRIAAYGLESVYVIPCQFIKKCPELIEITKPCFGSSKDNFLPRCPTPEDNRGFVENFPYNEIYEFLKAIHPFDENGGTIQFAEARSRQTVLNKAIFVPEKFLKGKKRTIPKKTKNLPEFKKALKALTEYYSHNFKKSEQIAESVLEEIS